MTLAFDRFLHDHPVALFDLYEQGNKKLQLLFSSAQSWHYLP